MSARKESSLKITDCCDCPIRKTTLFKNVLEERLDGMQGYRKDQVVAAAKSVIFHEDEVHDYVYTLFSGWAIIYKTVSNNNKRQILRFILPGDLIGYPANSSGAMLHSASAITKAVLCAFPLKQMMPMLKQEPALAVRLVEMESQYMSLCQNHLMAAGRKTARESISFLLLELFYRVRYQLPASFSRSSNSIDFPITQEDIGDAVGLTKIHVNRVIKELMKDGLISLHKKQLRIINERELCEIAEFSPDVVMDRPLT